MRNYRQALKITRCMGIVDISNDNGVSQSNTVKRGHPAPFPVQNEKTAGVYRGYRDMVE